MNFVRSIKGYDHLWSVKYPEKEVDELTILFRNWNNGSYLLDFFLSNMEDLRNFFHVHKITDAIKDTVEDAQVLQKYILDFPYTEHLDGLFHPLSLSDNRVVEMTREKARNWGRDDHASWLRIYAIRVEKNVYVITGGAIKLTQYMQERPQTQKELEKLNQCREFLKSKGVIDRESLIDLSIEQNDEKQGDRVSGKTPK